MSSKAKSFSSKIIQIYLIGASVLLAFYMYAFHAGVLITENTIIERRLNMVAPYHFSQLKQDSQAVITIDPLLTLYQDHAVLPNYIKSKISPEWTGKTKILLDDEREFQIAAQRRNVDGISSIVYAVEDSNAVEWDDYKFILIEITLGSIGLLLFCITALYMVRAAKRIAAPFLLVADKLSTDSASNFGQIQTSGEQSIELAQIVTALNSYRARLQVQIEREKSFTRYVSHELRTPMTIIKGALSNLKRDLAGASNKSVDKISKAGDQMQSLTQTFLLLARDGDVHSSSTEVNDALLERINADLQDDIRANQVDFKWQLSSPFILPAHPQLFEVVIINLLKNAFASSVDGKVTLMAGAKGIDVIDNGLGLDAKPRGYEGFGIGLVLVQDICDKYGWQFSLHNNLEAGCTASITFALEQTAIKPT